MLTGANDYPDLSEGWELLLLNQFHDILPGSSIRQVYEDSREDFDRIREIGDGALKTAQNSLLDNLGLESDSVVFFNSLSWARNELAVIPWSEALADKSLANEGRPLPSQVVEEEGERRLLVYVPNVPSLGYRAFPLVKAPAAPASLLELSTDKLENDFYRISLNERGQITSLFDKANSREVIADGARGNVFQAFEDKPLAFDAWDIDIFYQEKGQEIGDLIEAEVEEQGPLRGVLRLRWRFLDSTITQRLTLYAHSPRLDFRTEVDWAEEQILLKVAFPTTVRSTKATYDIQFGNIERPTHWNTSWDWARFEVVGHKWADLSEGNYGLALLNDCKYGYDVKDNVMRLTLIKSSIRPDATADKGRHAFTYSLLPHAGTWREAEVVRQAYALNVPLRAAHAPLHEGKKQQDGGLLTYYAFAELNVDHVILETVKRAEDGDAWIVRVYETKQYRNNAVTLSFGQVIGKAACCNLIEEDEEPVTFEDNRLTFPIAPYQIRTFKVWF